MDDLSYLLLVDGVPVCNLPAGGDLSCSLRSWSQAFGVPVTLTPEGCAMSKIRASVRTTARDGQFNAPVAELAAVMGMKAVIDPVTRRVTVWEPHRKQAKASGRHRPLLRPAGRGTKAR